MYIVFRTCYVFHCRLYYALHRQGSWYQQNFNRESSNVENNRRCGGRGKRVGLTGIVVDGVWGKGKENVHHQNYHCGITSWSTVVGRKGGREWVVLALTHNNNNNNSELHRRGKEKKLERGKGEDITNGFSFPCLYTISLPPSLPSLPPSLPFSPRQNLHWYQLKPFYIFFYCL